jgi:phage terminase Nu1 subunit (DNA packaging protein)
MVSEAYIGRLAKMEYLSKAGRGRWSLVNVVQGYIRFLKDEDRRSSKSASASRMTEVRTSAIEMKMATERRELVPREDVNLVLDSAASLMQSALMAVPSKYTRNLAEKRKLEKLIADALGVVADGMEKKAKALEKGQDVLGD